MFGKKLAKLRKEKNLSQYKLAEIMNLSRGQIANYEQGKREPDFETLNKIATFFGVSTDYLLGKTDDPTPYYEKIMEAFKIHDIGKELQIFQNKIKHTDSLLFNGEPLSEDAKESLLEGMEFVIKITKKLNKSTIFQDEDKYS